MATVNLNKTTTSGLSPTMQTYYDKKLLKNMKPKLKHTQFGVKKEIPAHGGKTVKYRKWTQFGALTTALAEGVVPDGQTLAQTEISASVSQYGGYVAVSDMLDMTAADPVINDAVGLMGDQGGLTVDTLCREVLVAGTNVLYANSKTARTGLTATDILTSTELRKARRILRNAKAQPFDDGSYVALVSPDTVYALQQDTDWKDVAKYQAATKIYDGEIGKLWGIRVIECDNTKVFTAGGASSADVGVTLVFGKNAYGLIDISSGMNVQSIIKPMGSAGTADPLNQSATIGWKVKAFTTKILNETWMLRIEHGIPA